MKERKDPPCERVTARPGPTRAGAFFAAAAPIPGGLPPGSAAPPPGERGRKKGLDKRERGGYNRVIKYLKYFS